MDNNSGFHFRKICTPGDRRLSKLNKKSEDTSFCYLIPNNQDLKLAKGSLRRHVTIFFFISAVCFESYVQVKLRFKISTSKIVCYTAEIVLDL